MRFAIVFSALIYLKKKYRDLIKYFLPTVKMTKNALR